MIAYISPAMGFNDVEVPPRQMPKYSQEVIQLVSEIQTYNPSQLSKLMGCSMDLAETTFARYQNFSQDNLTRPALLAFDGIAYRSLDAASLDNESLDYLADRLRILSGLYGYLKPFDGIHPYRLEMKTKLAGKGYKNLYEFWSDKIYQAMKSDSDGCIINLASKEYSKCIEKYLEDQLYITCSFKQEKQGKYRVQATRAKQARGAFIRYMAEHKITEPQKLKGFHELGYEYREDLSLETGLKQEFVFIARS